MDKVIREGTLRLLLTESTCDVILSCSDNRLMAHKLVLSIASPVFRELLQKHSSDSTSVLILPDINGSTMSAILDYIYTGTTVIYSQAVAEFLSIAKFLQIVVDTQNIENIVKNVNCVKKQDNEELIDCSNKDGIRPNNIKTGGPSQTIEINPINAMENETKYPQIKSQRKLPDLLPISSEVFRKNVHKKMCNIVVPSPWCPRDNTNFFGDPRVVPLGSPNREVQKPYLEDSNNNFQIKGNVERSTERQNSNENHLYVDSLEVGNEKSNDSSKNNFGPIDKYPKLSIRSSNRSNFRTNVEQLPNGISEISKLTTFPFSRHLTSLLPFRNNYLDTSTSCDNLSKTGNKRMPVSQPNSTSKKIILDETATNATTKAKETTQLDTFLSENSRKYHSPDITTSSNVLSKHLPFTKLPCTSETSNTMHPSSASRPSQGLSEKPLISTNDKESDSVTYPCDSVESSQDLAQDNSKDNSFSSDSSNDDKKEDKTVKKKSFQCKDCGKTFSQLRNYKYHRSVHEGTKEFSAKCQECGKTFNDKGYLSSHMKIHRDRKEYVCPDCPKRFNQRVAYNMHLRIHTGVKPHECPTCGKSFSRKMLLKQHQRVHTGERPYSCPECGKTFADRSNMSLHARLHTGVKPYACNICPKSFTKKHHLKTHMNFHTGLKPYTCENCGVAFSQSSNMRTHYKKCVLRENLSKTESLSSIDNNSS